MCKRVSGRVCGKVAFEVFRRYSISRWQQKRSQKWSISSRSRLFSPSLKESWVNEEQEVEPCVDEDEVADCIDEDDVGTRADEDDEKVCEEDPTYVFCVDEDRVEDRGDDKTVEDRVDAEVGCVGITAVLALSTALIR